MKTKMMFYGLALLALILSACGSAAPLYPTAPSIPPATSAPTIAPTAGIPVTGPTPTAALATAVPTAAVPTSGSATVSVNQSASLGSILADSKGMTLYIFSQDAMNTSNCSGSCAANWPPLLSNGAPVAGAGINPSLLGTITRSDGGSQVTYNGMPLYTFIGDKAPGDVTGQGVEAFFVINPAGMVINTSPAAGSGSGSGSSGSGYGSGGSSSGGSYPTPVPMSPGYGSGGGW